MKPPRLLPLFTLFSISLVLPLVRACAQSAAAPLKGEPEPAQSEPDSNNPPEASPAPRRFVPPAPRALPPDLPPLPSFPARRSSLPDFSDFDVRKRAESSLFSFGPNATEEAAQQQRLRVRYREAKARALADPRVEAALRASQTARSDRALREALQLHYSLLFEKMRQTDPSLRSFISKRESEALASLFAKATQQPVPRQTPSR